MTTITFKETGRTVERPDPVTIEEFLEQSRLWCEKYPPTPLSAEEQAEMDARFLLVAQRLLPKQYPTATPKEKKHASRR